MSKNFYIADCHFGHGNIIRFDNRPFKSLNEMHNTLIYNWNKVVTSDDTAYVLGDFCWGKEDMWKEISGQLKGNKVLISGNHDLQQMSKELRRIGRWQDMKPYKEITDNGKHIIMCHYPIVCYKAAYNPECYMLHGHVHTTRENDFVQKWTQELKDTRTSRGDSFGNIINVGCMMPWMNYTPRTLEEIIEWSGTNN